jgi:hypothetical protein
MDDLARRLRLAVDRSPLETSVAGGLHSCRGGTHSRLADGRRVCWSPDGLGDGVGFAIDAELAGQAVPPALGRRTGTLDPEWFWPAWTRAEVGAKLFDVPILVWFTTIAPDRRDAGASDEVAVLTTLTDGLVVSYGLRAPS